MHISCLFIFFAAQPGIGIGDSDGQLGCSFHHGFAVLRGYIVSNLCTIRFVAFQQHLSSLILWTRNFQKPLSSMGFASLLLP